MAYWSDLVGTTLSSFRIGLNKAILAASGLTALRTFTLPDKSGTFAMTSDITASGDVVGPASATDNALVLYDGTTGKLVKSSANIVGDATNSAIRLGTDLTLRRRAAATLQLGAPDSATPVAQTITAQGSRGGTDNNTAAPSLTVQSPAGTGNSTPSGIILQTPTVAGNGTGQQAQATRVTINSTAMTLTNNLVTRTGTGGTPSISLGSNNAAVFGDSSGRIGLVVNGGSSFGQALISLAAWEFDRDVIVGHAGNTNHSAGIDIAYSRISVGRYQIHNGTAGNHRDLEFRTGYLKGGLTLAGGAATAGSFTFGADDFNRGLDCTAAVRTATLPLATGTGRLLNAYKSDSSGNKGTVAAAGSDLIDGLGSVDLLAQYSSVMLHDVALGVWKKI